MKNGKILVWVFVGITVIAIGGHCWALVEIPKEKHAWIPEGFEGVKPAVRSNGQLPEKKRPEQPVAEVKFNPVAEASPIMGNAKPNILETKGGSFEVKPITKDGKVTGMGSDDIYTQTISGGAGLKENDTKTVIQFDFKNPNHIEDILQVRAKPDSPKFGNGQPKEGIANGIYVRTKSVPEDILIRRWEVKLNINGQVIGNEKLDWIGIYYGEHTNELPSIYLNVAGLDRETVGRSPKVVDAINKEITLAEGTTISVDEIFLKIEEGYISFTYLNDDEFSIKDSPLLGITLYEPLDSGSGSGSKIGTPIETPEAYKMTILFKADVIFYPAKNQDKIKDPTGQG